MTDRPPPWRGLLVLLTWIVWPVVYLSSETMLRMMVSTSRRCSIEGCSPPQGWGAVLSWIFVFGPPVWATVVWVRWRRRRRASTT